ncbi:hypothetical protein ACFOGG_08165 [Brenneria rubrifaciens]
MSVTKPSAVPYHKDRVISYQANHETVTERVFSSSYRSLPFKLSQ